MNVVGEWVGRGEPASSNPRGARLPPYTSIFGLTAFSASYVFASREV
jgi:hypothetical protein